MVKTKKGADVGTAPLAGRRFIRLGEVSRKTGLRESTVYYLMNRNEFPRCIKLSARAAAWDVEEVEDWMEERLAARNAERRDGRTAEVAS